MKTRGRKGLRKEGEEEGKQKELGFEETQRI